MAVNLGGKSRDAVELDYKFEYQFRHLNQMVVGESVLSDTFTHDGASWQLEVKKNPPRTNGWTRLECQLQLVTRGSEKPKLARICVLPYSDVISTGLYQQSGDKCDPTTFAINSRLSEVSVAVEVIKYSTVGTQPLKYQMAAEVQKWFESEDFGDTTLVATDGMKFRCHRDILSRRSSVFAGMFSSGMKESKENLVNIDGYKGEIVAAMLQFVYIDDCSEIGPIADRLYVAADQYQLEGLKILCETSLATNLSAKTVVKTYRLANFYHLDDLMARCVDYLNSHRSELPMEDLLAGALDIQ